MSEDTGMQVETDKPEGEASPETTVPTDDTNQLELIVHNATRTMKLKLMTVSNPRP